MTTDPMEARYGRMRRAQADRRLAIGLGGAAALLLVAFLIWAAFGKPSSAEGNITNFKAESGHSSLVSFSVNNTTGKAVTCLVNAVTDNDFAVGSRQVRIGARETSLQGLRIVTVQPATGAVVDSCWSN